MEPHGLVYPPNLLDALPVLHKSVRAISAQQFADIHLQHTLAHPPDNVLFPFLHGLEGDNQSQNTFFAQSAYNNSSSRQAHHDNTHITPKVPSYRGLVWVVCEEDLERAGEHVTLRVLRRKPVPAPGVAVAVGAQQDEDQPTPSSSSDDSDGDESEEDSVYEDDLDLDQDEQDMLLIMEAEDAAAASAVTAGTCTANKTAAAAAAASSASHSPRRASTSTSTSSPDLAPDLEEDDEDLDSVLASPVLQAPVGMDMQVDAVHVVQSSEDDTTDGILDTVDSIGGKDEKHFEGTHMHPVAHRPTPVPTTTLASGLGIALATDDILLTPSSSSSSQGHGHGHSAGSSSSSNSTSPSLASSPSEEADKQLQLQPQEPQVLSELQLQPQPLPSSQLQHEPSSSEHPDTDANTHTPKPPTNPAAPPLLTSTFRPKELLRRSRAAKVSVTHTHTHTQAQRPGLRRTGNGNGNGTATNPNQIRIPGRGGPVGRRKGVGVGVEAGTGAGAGAGGGGKPVLDQEDKEKEEEGWEFVPARVPDGISLRNFGIQVPIYATLSDVVVYSPYGATPAALALARRFRTAIRAKRAERLQAAGLGGDLSDDNDEDELNQGPNDDTTDNEKQERLEKQERRKRRAEFLEYNVFVLDAREEDLRRAVPHLMMRVCGAGVPGGLTPHGLGQVSMSGSDAVGMTESGHCDGDALVDIGAHTDGPDGHVIELGLVEAEARRKRKMEEEADMVVDMDMDIDVEAMDVDVDDKPNPKLSSSLEESREEADDFHLVPNTVDFALREREEMRDLTKASEIISLPPLPAAVPLSSSANPLQPANPNATRPNSPRSIPPPTHTSTHPHPPLDAEGDPTPVWDPRVGQVYLGNSGDVPLAPDVPSHFRHAASVPRKAEEAEEWDWEALTGHLRGVDGVWRYEDEEAEGRGETPGNKERPIASAATRTKDLSDDDPFNYLATNDPSRGFGYDICVECHDLAPFPSGQHLRAAEEHLGMLDVMWRERWEKAWMAREERRVRNQSPEEGGGRIRKPPPTPPRPPPHANAVIHLPFPSSPSNSQATMVALMPVIRFLEKWIQPLPVPVVQPPSPPPPVRTPTPEIKNLRLIGSVDPKKNAAGAAGGSSTIAEGTPTAPAASASSSSRRWSSVTSLMPSFPSFPGVGSSSNSSGNNSKEQPKPNSAPTPPPSGPLPPHPPHPARMRSLTSPSSSFQQQPPPTAVQARTRPLKILLYSSDGYTESSVPALCLLMAIKSLMLPEAYLELQVEKRRSFFVYQGDLGVLRRVEGRLREEREREKEKEREREREREKVAAGAYLSSLGGSINANGKRTAPAPVPTRGGYWSGSGAPVVPAAASSSSGPAAGAGSGNSARPPPPANHNAFMGRPAAKSVSFAHAPPPLASHYSQQPQQQPQHQVSVPPKIVVPSHTTHASQFEFGSLPVQASAAQSTGFYNTQQAQPQPQIGGGSVVKGRPRASTSPWLPSLFGGDHQSWFNDPRFDGSFPSRVLPFLYLGNLNHASNVYMLHALGITHVVSVGECALVPPPHHMALHGSSTNSACYRPSPAAHFVPGKGPGGHGSLWIEEREGRIKVLDIKGVCDDGIDTLEPQLEPICDWIDKARQEGGQVLVHCRVGVSRSATVTIAYVMKHLSLPLVDAYLIVRSRRLSVLIQPNMRLLYNLCGWEIKLAKERANGDERRLKKELARTLTWPYLAKEVHALNEKYLH